MKKKIVLLTTFLFLLGTNAMAATVKGKMDSSATEIQAQEAKAKAEAETGKAATVVRDTSGKVVEVQVNLPDHDNSGIERAKDALLSNKGIAAVEVEAENYPMPIPTLPPLEGTAVRITLLRPLVLGYTELPATARFQFVANPSAGEGITVVPSWGAHLGSDSLATTIHRFEFVTEAPAVGQYGQPMGGPVPGKISIGETLADTLKNAAQSITYYYGYGIQETQPGKFYSWCGSADVTDAQTITFTTTTTSQTGTAISNYKFAVSDSAGNFHKQLGSISVLDVNETFNVTTWGGESRPGSGIHLVEENMDTGYAEVFHFSCYVDVNCDVSSNLSTQASALAAKIQESINLNSQSSNWSVSVSDRSVTLQRSQVADSNIFLFLNIVDPSGDGFYVEQVGFPGYGY